MVWRRTIGRPLLNRTGLLISYRTIRRKLRPGLEFIIAKLSYRKETLELRATDSSHLQQKAGEIGYGRVCLVFWFRSTRPIVLSASDCERQVAVRHYVRHGLWIEPLFVIRTHNHPVNKDPEILDPWTQARWCTDLQTIKDVPMSTPLPPLTVPHSCYRLLQLYDSHG